MSQTQVRTIVVKVDAKGDADLKRISASLGQMNKEVKSLSTNVDQLTSFAGGIFGASVLGFGIRELAQMADSITNLNSKLMIFTGSQQIANRAMAELVVIADQTRASLQDTSTSFIRIVTATQRMNLALDANLALTRTLQNSFRLSGSNATEAAGATIQFAQALSFGALRGQELRSVLSQNAVLSTALTKAISGTGKSIFQFAEEGRFTSKFLLEVLGKNMLDINSKAEGMAQTFENTTTKALNAFTLKISETNKALGLDKGFATTVNVATENLGTMAAALLALFGPTIYAGISKLVALLSRINPYAAALTASVVTLSAVFKSGILFPTLSADSQIQAIGEQIRKVKEEAAIANSSLFATEKERQKNYISSLEKIKGLEQEIKDIRYAGRTSIFDDTYKNFDIIKGQLDPFGNSGKSPLRDKNVLLDAAAGIKETDLDKKKVTIANLIGQLNAEFNKGNIAFDEYNERLGKLQTKDLEKRLKDGSISFAQMHKEMRANELELYARQLDAGRISLQQFDDKIQEFKIEELNAKFRAGKINAADFYSELAKLKDQGILVGLSAGVYQYVDSLGTLSSQVAKMTESTFTRLEDTILDTLKGSTDAFAKFGASVIDELNRIAIRMLILKPLAEGFGGMLNGFFSTGSSAAGTKTYGRGQYAEAYADGGVVSSPSFFTSNGKLGVAGEAGPEAIMPLKRGANGQLGVQGGGGAKVQVNIINNSSSQITQRETKDNNGNRMLEVLIENTVNKGLAAGKFDRSMQSSYSLNRRGT